MRRIGLWGLLLAAGCGLGPAGPGGQRAALSADAGPPLGSYQVAPGDVAVAGLSAGAFLAVQLHVAASATFRRGAAIFAGGPYDCAQGSLTTAQLDCMYAQGSIDLGALEATTEAWADAGEVDPTANLAGATVWLWSGTQDTTVYPPVMDALAGYYQHYGASVTYRNTTAAGHGWISPDGPNACGAQRSPWLNDCGQDVEQELLGLLYGPLQPRSGGARTGALLPFAQGEFLDDADAPAHGLAPTGYLYAPAACASGASCHLLVALHGCGQSVADVGDAFLTRSGLLEWADSNDLLVLYPQATASPGNPQGCWDWWGYDDPRYARKSGRQMQAILRMVQRVSGPGGGSSSSSSSSGAASSSSASSSSGGTSSGSSSPSSSPSSSAGSSQGGGGSSGSSGSSGPPQGAKVSGGCGSAGLGLSPLATLALALLRRRARAG